MFFDFLDALLSANVGWFTWLLIHNVFWVFAFLALGFFFWEGNMRKVIPAFFLLGIVAWTWVDFELKSGWVLFVGGFLAVYYITKIAVLAFAEDTPSLQKRLIIVSELQFLLLVVIYNLFMR